MDVHREDARLGAGHDVPPTAQLSAGSSTLTPQPGTTHLIALDHLAVSLRTAGSDAAAMTWAQVAHRTLSAVQHAGPSSSTAGAMLKRRLMMNDALYRAFMLRKHGQRWQTFDGPTLLLAVDDLIAAEHNRPTPDA